MQLGKRGEQLIKEFESLHLEAYHGAADPPDVWTIGWGHTGEAAFEGNTITEEEAEQLFIQDTLWAVNTVNAGIDVETTQAQFDAMVSLTYNIGSGNFNASTLRRLHNQYGFNDVPAEFLKWRMSNGVIRRGLLRRRCQEAYLYCEDRWVS